MTATRKVRKVRNLRLSPPELESVRAAASAVGSSVHAWMRSRVLDSDESLYAQVRRLGESEGAACARLDIADAVHRACWAAGVPARVGVLPVPPHPGGGRYRYAVRVGDPREALFVLLAEWFVEVELEPFQGQGVLRGAWPGLVALLPEIVGWFRDFARDRPAWEVMST